MKKKFTLALFLLGIGFALYTVVAWRLNDGFLISHIESDLPFSERWVVQGQEEQAAQKMLAQPFYYLGKGSQCYVFASQDGEVVLKFFRHARYRLPFFSHFITAPRFLVALQNEKEKLKVEKREALFQSCYLGFTELHEETGLLYLHLNKTDHLQTQVILYDRLKRPYHIAIDNYEFMIQKRGEQALSYLSQLLQQGKKEEAKEALSQLAQLIARRIEKGIDDEDAVVHKNAGFCGNKAIFLDVGAFTQASPHPQWPSTQKLTAWLDSQDPDLSRCLTEVIGNLP